MKYLVYFSLVCLLACSDPGKSLGQFGQLYIYNVDGKYGICDVKKNNVCPLNYINIIKRDSFFFAQSEAYTIDVYSTHGKLICTCNATAKVTDSTFLAFWYHGEKTMCRMDIVGLAGEHFNKMEKPTAAYISSDGKADTLKGIIYWYSGNYIIVDSDNYKGLYQIIPYKMLVPHRYKTISPKCYNNYFLAWNDSCDFRLIHRDGRICKANSLMEKASDILLNENIFTIDSVSGYKIVYNSSGERVNLIRGIDNPPFYTSDGKLRVYGLNGISEMDSTGTTSGEFPFPQRGNVGVLYVAKDGLFNTYSRKYVVKAIDTSVRVYYNLSPALPFCSSSGDSITIYDAYGDQIVSLPRGLLGYRDKNNFFQTINSVNFYRHSETDRFVAYNTDLTKKFSYDFDDVAYVSGSHSKQFFGKVDGHWGLFRMTSSKHDTEHFSDSLQIVLPPTYDNIQEFFDNWMTIRNGIIKWFDDSAKILAGGKPFNLITNQVSKGKRLAFDAHFEKRDRDSPLTIYTKILIVDSLGNITGSQPINLKNTDFPDFFFFGGDRVLFVDHNGTKIWHAETGLITDAGNLKIDVNNLACTENGPLAVTCKGKDGSLGVYSLLEEKMVIPYGKFYGFWLEQYSKTAIAAHVVFMEGSQIIAIYDENGTVY